MNDKPRPTASFTIASNFMFKGPWLQMYLQPDELRIHTGTPLVETVVKKVMDRVDGEQLADMLDAAMRDDMRAWVSLLQEIQMGVIREMRTHIAALPPMERLASAIIATLDLPPVDTLTLVMPNQPAADIPFIGTVAGVELLIRELSKDSGAPKPRLH